MSRGRITWRMAIAAVVLGWVGLLLDRPVIIATDVVRVSAVFGSVLPMVAALAWGWRAGLLAATLGLGGLYGWLVWPENGWVNVFNSLMACVWFGAHGWAAERRELPGARWWHDAYAVESAYELTYAVYILTIFRWGFTLNPPFWSTAATREVSLAVAELIAIKSAINGFLVVLLADAAVRIGPLRRLLGLRVGPESRFDTWVVCAGLGVGLLLWMADSVVLCMVRNTPSWWLEIVRPEPERLISRLLLVMVCLAGAVLVSRFVRHRLRLSMALRRSEARFEHLFLGLSQALLVHDAQGGLLNANPAAARLLELEDGKLPPDAAWLEPGGLPVPDRSTPWGRVQQRGLSSDMGQVGYRAGRKRPVHWFLASVQRWPPEAPTWQKGTVTTLTDVTERRALQERVQRLEKLDVLGQMAGGIADDFDRILAEMHGREGGGELGQAEGLARELTGQLRGLARRGGRGQAVATRTGDKTGLTGEREPVLDLSGVRILLAEDSASVSLVMVKYLEAMGAEVMAVCDGGEAIACFDRNPEAFSVAILDHSMPGRSGSEVFRVLRARRPAMPVIMISGNLGEAPVGPLRAEGLAGVLEKPFERRDLAAVLGKVLGR